MIRNEIKNKTNLKKHPIKKMRIKSKININRRTQLNLLKLYMYTKT